MRTNRLLLSLGLGLCLPGALLAVGTPTLRSFSGAGQTRSLPAAPGGAPQKPMAGVVYGRSAYAQAQPGQAGYLYVGSSKVIAAPAAGATDKRLYTLSRGFGGDDAAVLQPVLQTPFKLNGAEQTTLDNLKCAGKVVNNLALMGNTYPVMTVTGDPATDPIDQIWYVNAGSVPLNILTNDTENINDAGGNPVNRPIQAIATAMTPVSAPTSRYIFAAVSEADRDFKTDTSGTAGAGANRGIAVTKLVTSAIAVLNCDDFSSTTGKAAKLSLLPADVLTAFVDDAAENPMTTAELASNDVVMHYDNANLQRLYIGLSGVKRDDPTKEGGVLSLVMGRILQNSTGSDTNFVLQPIVTDPAKNLFYTAGSENNTTGIVGFYADGVASTVTNGLADDGDCDTTISTRHIRTMRTSTGYDYVIVHTIMHPGVGGASDMVLGDQVTNQVYALPVAPNKTGVAADFVGQLVAVKSDGTPDGYSLVTRVYTPFAPSTFAQMPKATQAPAQVGAGLDLEVLDGTYVSELVVSGDSVYVTLDGINNHNAGIYKSSAIFNQYGFIRAWTPWQRVMGDMRRVLGMGLSTIDGTFTYLTPQLRTDLTTTNTFNTVRATSWGRSDNVTMQDPAVEDVAANNLSTVLEALFPQAEGGVLGMQSFDEYAPGFARGRFAMMIAWGTQKVALIQTGQFVNGEFEPVTTFSTTGDDQNVFVFDAADTSSTRGTALGAIAPLTSVVVGVNATGQGWVFVGGRGGMAVLSTDDSGEGFIFRPAEPNNPFEGLMMLSRDGAKHDEFPGGSKFSFKKLMPTDVTSNFDRVRSMAVAHDYLTFMTFDVAYTFELVETKFKKTAPASLDETVVATPQGAKLNDMVLLEGASADGSDDRILFATTLGIGYSNFDTASFVDLDGTGLTNPVIAKFAYLGQDRLSTTRYGNLYTLVHNLLTDRDSTFRFDVKANGDALHAQDVGVIREAGSSVTQPKAYIDFEQARSGIFPDGSFLYSTRSEDFGETEFLKLHRITDTTTVTSNLTNELAIDTNTNVLVDGLVREGASGTLMLPADWGVRVNQ